ncbi:MAG: KamA family radical SAM protein [Leptospiraceae bacterium]|nr:KamA family radical SAM protein [Leptospiraceae bacterium]MCP5512060.1 KamA family radical SAM protein [Leptospiraceae bacterium]
MKAEYSGSIESNRKVLHELTAGGDWKVQLQNSIRSDELKYFFELTESERIGIQNSIRLNVSTSPYYLLLSDPYDPDCPIRRTIIPNEEESILSPEESSDPLFEEKLMVTRGLTKMYDNRVLLFSNQTCSVYCRHCMRGRKVSFSNEHLTKKDLENCFEYLRNHPEIDDVVISGGDPLNMSDSRIEFILSELESIPSVKICRLGTRNPVTLPMRITDTLSSILDKYNTDNLSIFCNTQFNHEKECTPESKQAILKLLKSGVSVGNQAVLLRGINDDGESMLRLHKKLLEQRIRAYYLYDPELIPGSRGFRTPLGKGIEIVSFMRGKISGMGIPSFVNDLPGGGGKVTLSPDWYLGYHKSTRTHFFKSALRGTIHKSFEPLSSNYEDTYRQLSEEEYIELAGIAHPIENLP